MKNNSYVLIQVALMFVLSGCATPYDHSGEGATLGGVAGALAGGIIGHQSHDTAVGALIGGVLGATAGAVVGSEMPKAPEPYPYAEPVVVAQQPAVVASQVPTVVYTQDGATVNVPNDNGGYTAITLKRSGNGYIGPQGEYYPQIPSASQLKTMYGK